MRTFIATAAVMAASIGYPARADDASGPSSLRIEKDEAHKAFVFVIDGEPIALLDKAGLHVRDSIVYGGTLTDAGTASFDKRVEELTTEDAHEE